MGYATVAYSKPFEAALRQFGAPRLHLEQVLRAYQETFPHDAMKPDMRRRLRDAVVALTSAGVLVVPEGCTNRYQNEELPTVVELVASANFFCDTPHVIN